MLTRLFISTFAPLKSIFHTRAREIQLKHKSAQEALKVSQAKCWGDGESMAWRPCHSSGHTSPLTGSSAPATASLLPLEHSRDASPSEPSNTMFILSRTCFPPHLSLPHLLQDFAQFPCSPLDLPWRPCFALNSPSPVPSLPSPSFALVFPKPSYILSILPVYQVCCISPPNISKSTRILPLALTSRIECLEQGWYLVNS